MTKFILKDFHINVPEAELLEDILRVRDASNKDSVSIRIYDEYGKYSSATIMNRFGTWNNALKRVGLSINNRIDITEEELFLNIEKVWTKLGRQPTKRDLKKPLSDFSEGTYYSHFGSWRDALRKFVAYINSDEQDISNNTPENSGDKQNIVDESNNFIHRTKRNISDRLRFRILLRDGFTCQSCGRSPLKERDVELHVDHKTPWSKNGETIPDNLETKCSRCNLGKSNAFNE